MNAGILLRPIFFLSIITLFISEVSGQSLTDSLTGSDYRKTEIDNFEGAMRDFEIALSLQPSNNRAINGKITVLYLEGSTREARRLVDRAISDNPDFAGFYYTRGMISNQRRNYRNNRYDLAIEDFDRIININPRNDVAYYNRGMAFLISGNPGHACVDFHTACQIGSRSACQMIIMECQ